MTCHQTSRLCNIDATMPKTTKVQVGAQGESRGAEVRKNPVWCSKHDSNLGDATSNVKQECQLLTRH